ncbi:MAG: hypothetical protein V4519_03580 [Patescibacteria group bacterium]
MFKMVAICAVMYVIYCIFMIILTGRRKELKAHKRAVGYAYLSLLIAIGGIELTMWVFGRSARGWFFYFHLHWCSYPFLGLLLLTTFVFRGVSTKEDEDTVSCIWIWWRNILHKFSAYTTILFGLASMVTGIVLLIQLKQP